VYGRSYDGKTLRFEASGGLLHNALVMADRETDSYWSILTGDALAGPMEGTELEELPLGIKARWDDWVAEHPDTSVLSVDGQEHVEDNPYKSYFASDAPPWGADSWDERLPPKQPIYAFQRNGRKYAVPFATFEGGTVFELEEGGDEVFLYRPEGEAIFYSTLGWVGDFEIGEDGRVRHIATGAVFDPGRERFIGAEGEVPRLEGFDTFWYHWSKTHPGTAVLGES